MQWAALGSAPAPSARLDLLLRLLFLLLEVAQGCDIPQAASGLDWDAQLIPGKVSMG